MNKKGKDPDLFDEYLSLGMDDVMCFADYERMVEEQRKAPMHKAERVRSNGKECE